MVCRSAKMSAGARTGSNRQVGLDDRHAIEDGQFLFLGRIADLELEHEAIDLGLGQMIGAFLLDGVLRRHAPGTAVRADGCASPMVTCFSCIASSSALCTLAGARLISSARTRLAKIGPFLTVNSPVRGL